MEGCREGGSVCRRVLKPRFLNPPTRDSVGKLGNRDDKLRVSLMGNFEQMQLQQKERVQGWVGGRSASDCLCLAFI